jgi:hypothetical protein
MLRKDVPKTPRHSAVADSPRFKFDLLVNPGAEIPVSEQIVQERRTKWSSEKRILRAYNSVGEPRVDRLLARMWSYDCGTRKIGAY